MDLGPHQKVFVTEASMEDGRVVAFERTLTDGPQAPAQVAPAEVAVARPGAALRFKRTVGAMLQATAKLLYLSPVLLLIAPVARWLYKPAPAYVLAMFVSVVVLFFAVFDLFVVASIVAWLRRGRGARAVFTLPRWNDAAIAPSPARGVLGRHVRCVGKATLLATGTEPVLRAAWWTGDAPTELVLCSTFAVVPEAGPPVIVRHRRPPRLFPGPAGAMTSDEVAAIASVHEGAHDAALAVSEGDWVELQGLAVELVDNASHFEIDGVTSGLPAPEGREDAPYRAAPGGPALVVEDAVLRKVRSRPRA